MSVRWAYYRINETFKKENKELWEYLKVELKKPPTYQMDYEKYKNCKEDICEK